MSVREIFAFRIVFFLQTDRREETLSRAVCAAASVDDAHMLRGAKSTTAARPGDVVHVNANVAEPVLETSNHQLATPEPSDVH